MRSKEGLNVSVIQVSNKLESPLSENPVLTISCPLFLLCSTLSELLQKEEDRSEDDLTITVQTDYE